MCTAASMDALAALTALRVASSNDALDDAEPASKRARLGRGESSASVSGETDTCTSPGAPGTASLEAEAPFQCVACQLSEKGPGFLPDDVVERRRSGLCTHCHNVHRAHLSSTVSLPIFVKTFLKEVKS